MYFRPSSGISSSLLSILLIPAANSSLAQCSNSASYGGGTAPSVGNTLTMTTCQWSGEYATVTGVAAGATFQSTSSIATDHITVRRGVPGGTLVAFGTQPLSWTAPVAGTYYIHCNTNGSCGTQNSCRITSLTAISAMAYASSTTTQANTSPVTKCSLTDKEVIGVQVVMTGSSSPMNITQFTLRTNGSTSPVADLTNIRIYCTGTSNVFNTTNPFGSALPAAAGTNIPVNGTRNLVSGTNYFWVTYDLNAAIPPANVLDARCMSIVVGGTSRTPSATNPAGMRTVAACPPHPAEWTPTY